MIHDIPKPEISPEFTIEDIHIIQEWNYTRLKDATVSERIADTKRRASVAQARIEMRRKARQVSV